MRKMMAVAVSSLPTHASHRIASNRLAASERKNQNQLLCDAQTVKERGRVWARGEERQKKYKLVGVHEAKQRKTRLQKIELQVSGRNFFVFIFFCRDDGKRRCECVLHTIQFRNGGRPHISHELRKKKKKERSRDETAREKEKSAKEKGNRNDRKIVLVSVVRAYWSPSAGLNCLQ